jgi:hypothetical protein
MSLLVTAAVVLLGLLGWSIWEDVVFHRQYPHGDGWDYVRLRGAFPVCVWLIALIFALGAAAIRIARGRSGQTTNLLASRRAKRIAALGFTAYCVCVAGVFLHVRDVKRRKQAEYDLRSVIIKGNVVDDRGLPVVAIEVDLVPILEDSDTQSRETVQEWTDEKGEYTLRPERTGHYFLSVLWNAPPSTKLPFMSRYYPDAPDQSHAETLEISAARHLGLAPIRLRRLEAVKVPVSVSWSNGKVEPDAYLFFRNNLFPKYGSIGNEALHPDADGTVSLPAGFDYHANAQVDCDGGQVIDNAYTPELTFSTKPMNIPITPLHFVLPGAPCQVWHSK